MRQGVYYILCEPNITMPPKVAFEEPEESEYMEEEDEDYTEGLDVASLFMTEEGDNVATALVKIGDHVEKLGKMMDTQNKILIKMLTQISVKKEEH